MPKPIVAIVGRPNVGKSALFNRIVGRRIAIVQDEPGVTRDRIYANTSWTGRPFTLIDTGGLQFGKDGEPLAEHTKTQAQIAVDQADVVLFVVDARAGVLPSDLEVASVLRKTKKPVILAANKVDHGSVEMALGEFYSLGFGEPIGVSAEHGRAVGDLLDRIVASFPQQDEDGEDPEQIRVAVVGRPNVGKSSLTNYLLGQQRSIVSDVPGTTRDAVDSQVEIDGQNYVLIDTAGIRRKSRIDHAVEHYSVLRALRAVDRSDVVFLLLDGTELATEQDKRIGGYAHEAGKGLVIVVNKWDLVEKDEKTMKEFEQTLRRELGFLQYAPIAFISAKTGQRVNRLLPLASFVSEQQNLRIPTGRLNELLHSAVTRRPPPADKGVRLRFFYGTQVGVKPPTIILFVNDPKLMHYSYLRYLENQLREHFGFIGTPIVMRLRQRKS